MSLPRLQEVVDHFLSSDVNDVLVLKGPWGTGKTYFWKDRVEAAIAQQSSAKSTYSYVSLFGISNIEQLKAELITSSINEDGSWLSRLATAAKYVADAKAPIPNIDSSAMGSIAQSLLFRSFKDAVVCLDDLERMGSDMSAKEVLGVATQLKEEKNCKVAIILNDNPPQDDDVSNGHVKEFSQYAEKLVDIELHFKMSPVQASDIVFDDSVAHSDILQEACVQLKIHNIRILQRIQRWARYLNIFIEERRPGTIRRVLRSLSLIVWSYYNRAGRSPSLDYIRSFNDIALLLSASSSNYWEAEDDQNEEDEDNEREERWAGLLNNFGYKKTEPIDAELMHLVQKGYFATYRFSELLDELDSNYRARAYKSEIRKVWEEYNSRFGGDLNEFGDNLREIYSRKPQYLDPDELDTAVRMLRKMNREEEADDLVDHWVDKRQEPAPRSLLQPSNLRWNSAEDEYLLKRARETNRIEDPPDLGQSLRTVYAEDTWGAQDTRTIQEATQSDYYIFIKGAVTEGDLHAMLRWYLKRGDTGTFGNASEKIREALASIASESDFDRLRIEEIYGDLL